MFKKEFMQENHFLPVNWIDGMKINKTHFIAQENAMTYQLAQNTSCMLNELNYGLLPVITGGAGLKLFISTDNQRKLQVRIQQCRAITAGGYYIEFNEDTVIHGSTITAAVVSEPASLKDLRKQSSEFYIVLSINPYKRHPHGLVDVVEIPPRLPFTVPTFSVDLIPVEEVARNILGGFQLPVGKLSIEEQRVFLEEDYIPPCTCISSHPELLEIHAGLEQFYGKMETYSLQIIQKIIQKKQSNDMAPIVQKLCENILAFTASQLAELKSSGVVHPPVSMIVKISSLSRLMKNTMDCYLGSGKEELVTYFTEWCNVSQGELERIIMDLSNHQYDHLDINHSMDKVTEFTKIVSGLFHRLARLEYIGKRKEAGIFVKEEVVKQAQENPVQRRRSFLAD
jgi:hypothetical protein